MRWLAVFFAAILLLSAGLPAQETTSIPVADSFECPVGRDGLKQSYKARGFRPNGHWGEDWNGAGGGDSDLGDPVCATANGLVVYAQNYKMGWGNVVILRHAYVESGKTQFVDSLYGHLHEILVRGLPLLCICKGLQVLNLALGGTLHLHIEGHNLPELRDHNLQAQRYSMFLCTQSQIA